MLKKAMSLLKTKSAGEKVKASAKAVAVAVEEKLPAPMRKGGIVKRPSLVKARANLIADVTFLLASLGVVAKVFGDQLPWLSFLSAIAPHADVVAAGLVGAGIVALRVCNVVSSTKAGLFDWSGPDSE